MPVKDIFLTLSLTLALFSLDLLVDGCDLAVSFPPQSVELYLLLFFLPPLYALIFYGVNGYLLGREYFEQVALRRLDPAAARMLRRAHQGQVLLAGVVIAFLLTVPLVNLIAPIVATAFMLHLVTGLTRPGAQAKGG